MPSSYPKFAIHLLSENTARDIFLLYILQRYENEQYARKLLICNLTDQDGVTCEKHKKHGSVSS